MNFHEFTNAVAIGIGATIAMDLWNLILKRTFGIPSLDYRLLGRWLLHIPSGIVRHENIKSATAKPFEHPAGWIAHYGIGISLTVVFIALVSGDWIAHPTLTPALVYGLATVVFPFFVLQPALGLGIASSKAPKPIQARLKSLATHAVFGFGMFVTTLGMALATRA